MIERNAEELEQKELQSWTNGNKKDIIYRLGQDLFFCNSILKAWTSAIRWSSFRSKLLDCVTTGVA